MDKTHVNIYKVNCGVLISSEEINAVFNAISFRHWDIIIITDVPWGAGIESRPGQMLDWTAGQIKSVHPLPAEYIFITSSYLSQWRPFGFGHLLLQTVTDSHKGETAKWSNSNLQDSSPQLIAQIMFSPFQNVKHSRGDLSNLLTRYWCCHYFLMFKSTINQRNKAHFLSFSLSSCLS